MPGNSTRFSSSSGRCRVDGATANILIAIALALATPFFILFGWLSDRIGRKPIILAGCALAALTYFPLFEALSKAANPALHAAQASAPVRVVADPADCSVQFDPIGRNKFDARSCDIVKVFLARSGVSYANVVAPPGTPARLEIGGAALAAPRGGAEAIAAFQVGARAALTAAGYPERADPARVNRPLVVLILFVLVLYVTMVYGPIAALLVELFPTRIRYSSMSLPLPYRQRLVRRLPPHHRLRDGRRDGRHLLRPLVSDRRGGG